MVNLGPLSPLTTADIKRAAARMRIRDAVGAAVEAALADHDWPWWASGFAPTRRRPWRGKAHRARLVDRIVRELGTVELDDADIAASRAVPDAR